jgi:hypothetical protein
MLESTGLASNLNQKTSMRATGAMGMGMGMGMGRSMCMGRGGGQRQKAHHIAP